jgi:hypothetical protein
MPTEMSNEELIAEARKDADSGDNPRETNETIRELASRLEAALERERLDVEVIKSSITMRCTCDKDAPWYRPFDSCPRCVPLESRLAGREKEGSDVG